MSVFSLIKRESQFLPVQVQTGVCYCAFAAAVGLPTVGDRVQVTQTSLLIPLCRWACNTFYQQFHFLIHFCDFPGLGNSAGQI